MTPEEKARLVIDEKLQQSGWIIQDMKKLNLSTSLGVAVREFPTSTGEVDYALFVDGRPVGIIEAKREEAGESITDVEVQSGRYAHSTFKWIKNDYAIRFVYEATNKLIRFTDYQDIKYRSRPVFSFFRPETLRNILQEPNTLRNNMKHFPPLDETGFRKCQINAIQALDRSFAENRPKALVQMATGAGKTFTAITTVHFTLKQHPMTNADLVDFVKCYNPENRYERIETWSENNPDGRFRRFNITEILKRDKTSLDLFWIKDKSLADLDDLPEPDELAADIIENLQSALDSFQELQAQLGE